MNSDQFSAILENLRTNAGLDLTTPRTTLHGQPIALDRAIMFTTPDATDRVQLWSSLLDERPTHTELSVRRNNTSNLTTLAFGRTDEGKNEEFLLGDRYGIQTHIVSGEDIRNHFDVVNERLKGFSQDQFKSMVNQKRYVESENMKIHEGLVPNRGDLVVSHEGRTYKFNPRTQEFSRHINPLEPNQEDM